MIFLDIKKYYKIIYSRLKKIYLFNFFPLFIILLGFIIRLRQYLANRSLWIDEASLALNILEKDYVGLLQKLDYVQAAPPLFLLITKFLTELFGNSEYVLRLLPFISGVLSLFLFYKIANEFLNKGEIPIALALLSFTYYNIYYSAEFKQYSLELLFAIIILLFGIKLYKSNYSNYNILLSTIMGSIAVWFSHTSVFILAGVGLALLLKLYISDNLSKGLKIKKIIYLILGYLIWIVSFAFQYFLIIREAAENQFYNFWQGYFFPFPPLSIYDIKEYFALLAKFIINPLGFNYALGVVVFFILIGEYFLWKEKDKIYFYLSNLPVMILIIFSILNIYPFAARLVLFITPIFYLIISIGIYNIFTFFAKQNKELIAILLIFITLLYPVAKVTKILISPISKEEIRPVINYYLDNKKNDDSLYVYYGAERAFKYYTQGENILYISSGGNKHTILGGGHRENPNLYLQKLDDLKGNGQIWFIFSHAQKCEKELFLIYLNKIGNRIDSFERTGASVYLYDL